MSPKKISLTPEQTNILESQKGKLSIRQLAKRLQVSREDLKELLREESGAAPPGASRERATWFLLGIALLVFISFSSSLGNEFVWDARDDIVGDPTLGDPSHFFQTVSKPLGYFNPAKSKVSLWRPTATASFFLDALIWKKRAFGFALTSILLHALVSILFFLVLRRLLSPDWFCFVAAAVYAVHPVHSEAVAYIPSRGDILCGLFTLAALLSYRRRAFLSWAAFLLAVYSKETGLVFLGLLPAYGGLAGEETTPRFKALIVRALPYLVCVLIYFFTRWQVLGGIGSMVQGGVAGSQYAWNARLWIQPVYFINYLKMIFMPVGLHTWRQVYFPQGWQDPVYLLSFIAVAAFGGAAYYGFKRCRPAFFGFVWFALFLLPVSNLFFILIRPVLEHWLYIPLMGFILFLFSLLRGFVLKSRFNRALFASCAAVAIPLLMFLTFMQNKTWKDEVTLWERTTRYVKEDALPYYNLGHAYLEKREMDKAETFFKRTLEIDPGFEDARHNLRVMQKQREAGS